MLSFEERMRYLKRIEAAEATLLADPEIAAEYASASQAWDSTIMPAIDVEKKSPSTPRRTSR